MAFNQLSDAQAERLDILQEEALEVGVAISKIKRHGYGSYDPTADYTSTNRMDLLSEFEQMLGCYMNMIDEGDAIPFSMERAKATWLEKLQWTHHQLGTKEEKPDWDLLVGVTYEAAERRLSQLGLTIRRYEGLITADFKDDRLNVKLDKDSIITDVVGFG